jgi:putative transposase
MMLRSSLDAIERNRRVALKRGLPRFRSRWFSTAAKARAAANLYNAVLQEMLARLEAMRASPAWHAARKVPANKSRTALFRAAAKAHGFGKAEAEAYGRTVRDACWINDHLGGHDTQTTAARAFAAVENHLLRKRGKPRFKATRRFRSIASKDDRSIMRMIALGGNRYAVEYRGLAMAVHRRKLSDFDRHALSCPIRTLRIVRKTDAAKDRYAVQVVVEGLPWQARVASQGHVGIDVGPSMVAVVSDADASLERLCPGVKQPWKALRRIERAMDRSRKATNPKAFDEEGRYRRGRKIAVRSNRYLKLARRRASLR